MPIIQVPRSFLEPSPRQPRKTAHFVDFSACAVSPFALTDGLVNGRPGASYNENLLLPAGLKPQAERSLPTENRQPKARPQELVPRAWHQTTDVHRRPCHCPQPRSTRLSTGHGSLPTERTSTTHRLEARPTRSLHARDDQDRSGTNGTLGSDRGHDPTLDLR